MHDTVHDVADQAFWRPRQRAVRTHPAGVGSGVSFTYALEVLCWQQRHGGRRHL